MDKKWTTLANHNLCYGENVSFFEGIWMWQFSFTVCASSKRSQFAFSLMSAKIQPCLRQSSVISTQLIVKMYNIWQICADLQSVKFFSSLYSSFIKLIFRGTKYVAICCQSEPGKICSNGKKHLLREVLWWMPVNEGRTIKVRHWRSNWKF